MVFRSKKQNKTQNQNQTKTTATKTTKKNHHNTEQREYKDLKTFRPPYSQNFETSTYIFNLRIQLEESSKRNNSSIH